MNTPDERLRMHLEEAEKALKELDGGRPREFRSDPNSAISVYILRCGAGITKALESARRLR